MSMTVIAGCVCLFVIAIILINIFGRSFYRNKFPLEIKKRLLSVEEHNFLKSLERALDDDCYIFSKVQLSEITTLDKKINWIHHRVARQQLDSVCTDFVLCKKNDMSILGIVELEKFSKMISPKQKQYRERLLSSVCRKVDIRLFYFDGRQDYSGMDLCRLITGKSKTTPSNRASAVAADPSMVSVQEDDSMMETEALEKIRSCPKCYSDVVVKIAVKGENIGEKFLMCRKYPYCDYQLPVKDVLLKKMREKEDRSRGKAGYRNWS